MKLFAFLAFFMFINYVGFAQTSNIVNYSMSIEDKMLSIDIPEITGNKVRIVEVFNSKSELIYMKRTTNCNSSGKSLLKSGEYTMKFTIIENNEKIHIEKLVFLVL